MAPGVSFPKFRGDRAESSGAMLSGPVDQGHFKHRTGPESMLPVAENMLSGPDQVRNLVQVLKAPKAWHPAYLSPSFAETEPNRRVPCFRGRLTKAISNTGQAPKA